MFDEEKPKEEEPVEDYPVEEPKEEYPVEEPIEEAPQEEEDLEPVKKKPWWQIW